MTRRRWTQEENHGGVRGSAAVRRAEGGRWAHVCGGPSPLPAPGCLREAVTCMTPLRVRHRLIIRHPSGSTVLFVNTTGAPRLPSFVSEDRHTADVDYINDAAWEQLGLHTTVLRSHWHSEVRDGVVDVGHQL